MNSYEDCVNHGGRSAYMRTIHYPSPNSVFAIKCFHHIPAILRYQFSNTDSFCIRAISAQVFGTYRRIGVTTPVEIRKFLSNRTSRRCHRCLQLLNVNRAFCTNIHNTFDVRGFSYTKAGKSKWIWRTSQCQAEPENYALDWIQRRFKIKVSLCSNF